MGGEAQGTRLFDLIGHASDVDSAPGSLTISGTPSVTVTDGNGTVLAVDPSAYSFANGQLVLDTNAFTFLNQGDAATVHVSYAVTDGQAVSTPATYDVIVVGDYDRISGDGIVTGTAYEDIVTSGAGDDTLDSGASDDILIGGEETTR